jgi:hypothetical protein
MTPDEIEAIRERVALRAEHELADEERDAGYAAGMRDDDFDWIAVEDYESAKADIETLLTEVGQLRQHILAAHACRGCHLVIGVDKAEYQRLHEAALDKEYGA